MNTLLLSAKNALPLKFPLHSLLTSDLGAELPLHISLSRTLMLGTEQRQPYTKNLEQAIGVSGVKP